MVVANIGYDEASCLQFNRTYADKFLEALTQHKDYMGHHQSIKRKKYSNECGGTIHMTIVTVAFPDKSQYQLFLDGSTAYWQRNF